MSSLFEDDDDDVPPVQPGVKSNQAELTVSELSSAIKRTVEDRFGLVRVRAEIGRVSRPRSGHVYLSLKDDKAVIDGVMWKGVASRLTVQPEEGLEVVVTGKLTTFAGQSKYQIVIDKMEPAGAGALMAMLEARRKALAAEGLFDQERKRELPALPKVIGVVTSPSGAVIRDILHRIADRFPSRVIVWPVAVQGEKCAPEVAAAIRGFDALQPAGPVPRPDVVIVARGGGSLEDLWGFNEEMVVRAAADCSIPLISAVGHETDTTLIDHAADLRAPTPTGAAEKVVPVRAELFDRIETLSARRSRAMQRKLRDARERVAQGARILPKPETLLAEKRQRLDLAAERLPRGPLAVLREKTQAFRLVGDRLPRAMASTLERQRGALATTRGSLRPTALSMRLREARTAVEAQSRRLHGAAPRIAARKRDGLAALGRTLNSLSYLRVLDRGFAVVRDAKGGIIADVAKVTAGDTLAIEFKDRKTLPATAGESGSAPKKRPRKAKTPSAGQADLFGD